MQRKWWIKRRKGILNNYVTDCSCFSMLILGENGDIIPWIAKMSSQISSRLTVYCLNGANAPRYCGCLSAIFYDKEAIKATGSIGLSILQLSYNDLTQLENGMLWKLRSKVILGCRFQIYKQSYSNIVFSLHLVSII